MTQAVPGTAAQSRDFFNQRLHDTHRRRPRLRWRDPRRVTRRICMQLEPGATEVIPLTDSSMVVTCAQGSVWITHDSDPKDVILGERQSYRAEREDTMRMSALSPCLLEIQFEDELDDA